MCHFVPARATDTAEDTAILLINAVIKHHGCPAKIISAYHPQSTHATLYDILRSIVNRWGTDWAQHLALAEFAFNSSVCTSTGFSLFEVVCGRRASFPGDLAGRRSDVPRAEAAATRILALTTACRDHSVEQSGSRQETSGTPVKGGGPGPTVYDKPGGSSEEDSLFPPELTLCGTIPRVGNSCGRICSETRTTGKLRVAGITCVFGTDTAAVQSGAPETIRGTPGGAGSLYPHQGTTAFVPIVGSARGG
jgi:hypothetical protein